MSRIENEYFEWMYDLILNKGYPRKLSYRKLLKFLHDIEFTYILDEDESRAIDGQYFRYRFGGENGYSNLEIERGLRVNDLPCSVLEMMVALSFRIEEQIMDDYDYGNRTGQWFWNMITSLDLGGYNDTNFTNARRKTAEDIIGRLLSREYKPNGEGGLFTLEHPKCDLRDVDIWTQAMWFLDENFDFSIS